MRAFSAGVSRACRPGRGWHCFWAIVTVAVGLTGVGCGAAPSPTADAASSVAADGPAPVDSPVVCSDATCRLDTACSAGMFFDGTTCLPCKAACVDGTFESQSCSTEHDRVCAPCTPIADCAAERCTNASDQTCTACTGGTFWTGSACAPCTVCVAGQEETTACSPAHDRICTACAPIANCLVQTCTTTEQSCQQCASGHYLKEGVCVACSGACPSGSYELTACGAGSDRVCAPCTGIAHCTSATCTTASDQVCSTCGAGFFAKGGACVACATACAAGQYQSATCAATHDLVCSPCPSLANCSAVTCTSVSDAVCTTCAAGRYWNGTACVPCTTCAAGEQESTSCTTMHDRTCTKCTVIPSCASETCTTATDQICHACAEGHHLAANACPACAAACGPGTYESLSCSSAHDRACTSCTAIPHCAAETCTNGTDQTCVTCADGYYLSGNVCLLCDPPCADGTYLSTTCTSQHNRGCSACTPIPHCAAGLVCDDASHQTCGTCAPGFVATGHGCTALSVEGYCTGAALTNTPFADGVAENPHKICTLAQLDNIRNAYLSASFQLLADLDANVTNPASPLNGGSAWNNGGLGWSPIGVYGSTDGSNSSMSPFTGTFDGHGHKIYGLFIHLQTDPAASGVGLFGAVENGSVHDLALVDANVTGNNFVGAMIGFDFAASLLALSSAGTVSGRDSVGGLIGQLGIIGGNNGGGTNNVNNCSSSATVSASVASAGGLIGRVEWGSVVSQSFATGSVTLTGSGMYAGGLVGYEWSSNVVDCYATGNVTAPSASEVGGLVGHEEFGSTLGSSYATGNVVGSSAVGGLVGFDGSGYWYDSFATGTVTGSMCVGGLIGDDDVNGGNSNNFWDSTRPRPVVMCGCHATACTNAHAVANTPSYWYSSTNSPQSAWQSPPWIFSGTAYPTLP